MTEKENFMRTVKFGNPQWMPITIAVTLASLIEYKREMEEVMARFPEYFGEVKPGNIDYSKYDEPCDWTEYDNWGCKWHYSVHGIDGAVVSHPLEDWDNFADYKFPDPIKQNERTGERDWQNDQNQINFFTSLNAPTHGGLIHGFSFLRMQYLRGFENLMCDMALEEPMLFELISKNDEYNLAIVNKYLSMGVDVMGFPEDIGAENSMVISKEMFQKYIKPSYKKLTQPCKDARVITHIHSDGYILPIIDDLIDVGMDIVNPQDLCNGIDELARAFKGKVCINLDLDRVKITPKGSRADIFDLIETEIKTLGSKEGGLYFVYGVYPPTTPDSLAYVCEAFNKYKNYWFE